MTESIGERCAATVCSRLASLWAYSPTAGGLVPTCRYHDLDIVAGGSKVDPDAPVLERGGCVSA